MKRTGDRPSDTGDCPSLVQQLYPGAWAGVLSNVASSITPRLELFRKGQEKSVPPKSLFLSLTCLRFLFLSAMSDLSFLLDLRFGELNLCCSFVSSLLCDLKRSLTFLGLIFICKWE